MGRKLDPTRKEKRGPGRKARKQRGAEVELARFLPPGKPGPAWCRLAALCAARAGRLTAACLSSEPETGKKKLSSHGRKR